MKIRPHKLTSVVWRLDLGPEVTYSRRIEATNGQVLVVKALEENRGASPAAPATKSGKNGEAAA